MSSCYFGVQEDLISFRHFVTSFRKNKSRSWLNMCGLVQMVFQAESRSVNQNNNKKTIFSCRLDFFCTKYILDSFGPTRKLTPLFILISYKPIRGTGPTLIIMVYNHVSKLFYYLDWLSSLFYLGNGIITLIHKILVRYRYCVLESSV